MQTKSAGLTGVALVLVGLVALSGLMLAVAMLGQHRCGGGVALQAGPANATARKQIPPQAAATVSAGRRAGEGLLADPRGRVQRGVHVRTGLRP